MEADKLLTDLRRALECSELELSTPLRAIKTWDSLAAVEFVSLLDSEYGVTVSFDELVNCSTVGDLVRLANGPHATAE